jgi:uncharacterized repeat protein (TIGR02543 family)
MPTSYWTDDLTEKPEGFVVDGNGNVTVSSAEGLAWLSVLTSGLNDQTKDDFEGKTITLSKDIDLSKKLWVPIGRYKRRGRRILCDEPFKGTFNGSNHIIYGLKMSTFPDSHTNSRKNKYYGLFAYVKEGTIKNIHLSNVYIDTTVFSITSLVARFIESHMENCTATGKIKAGCTYGLVQEMEGGGISKCAFSGTLISTQNGSAGIVDICDGTIEECYANVIIDSVGGSGGICLAHRKGTISNCYTTGSMDLFHKMGTYDGQANSGGICSYVENNCTVENCYSTMTIEYKGEKDESKNGGIVAQAVCKDNTSDPVPVIKGCVALNDTIKGSANSKGEAGRIVGSVKGGSISEKSDDYVHPKLMANYGYSGMKTFAGDEKKELTIFLKGLPIDERKPSEKQGADITAKELREDWPVKNWNDNIWSFENDKLPTLKNISNKIAQTGEISDYINADSEKDWNITAFDELTETPEVVLGCSKEKAIALLPTTLLATKDNTTAVSIPDITWTCSDFDGNTMAKYTFTPVLPSGYTTTADLPTAKVHVRLGYTVTLHTNGVGDIQLDADQGSLVTIPDSVKREGFTLEGWYQDENCTKVWNLDTDKVTSSITLYAKWRITGEPDYVAAASGAQKTLDVSKEGFSNASIVRISDVKGYTTYAVVDEGKIDFSVPAGEYVIADSGETVESKNIRRFTQNKGETPSEIGYKGTGRGTEDEPVTMLGSFFTKDASQQTKEADWVSLTFRVLNLITGYDINGKKYNKTPHYIVLEDRDTSTGQLKASFTIDGRRLKPCDSDGWFRSPRTYGIALNPSDALINGQFDMHAIYSSIHYPERRAAALKKLKAVREDEKRVLMQHTQMRDFPGPITFKLDVSKYFKDGDTVNINYLLGAAKIDLFHGIHIKNEYALAIEPIYFKNDTSAVVTNGYITVDLRNGGYFELVKKEDDKNKETKYVVEFETNNPEEFEKNGGSTIHPQILTAEDGYKITKPEDPTKGKYPFGGWYTDKELTSEYNFETPVTKNMILYAKWIGEDGDTTLPGGEFTVTFVTGNDPDTGEPNATIDEQKVKSGECAKDPGFFDSGYGYLVIGWYTDSDLTNKYNFSDKVTADLKLHPKWMRYILKDDLKKEGGSGSEGDPYLAHLADSSQSKIAWKALNKLAGKSQWWEVYVTEDNSCGKAKYKWKFNGKDIKKCNIAQPYYTDVNVSRQSSNSVQADLTWRTAIEGKLYVSVDVSEYFKNDTEIKIAYVDGSCDGKVVHTDISSGDWVDSLHHPSTYYSGGTTKVVNGFATLELTHGGRYTLTANETTEEEVASVVGLKATDENSVSSVNIMPKVEAKNGVVAFAVNDKEINSAIDASIEVDADVIVIAPVITGEADELSVELNKTALSSVLDKTKSDLMLKTGMTNVVISKNILAKIVAKDGDKKDDDKVVIHIKKGSEDEINLEIKLNDEVLKGIGDVMMAVPVKNADSGMVAVLVKEDGSEEVIKKSVFNGSEMLVSVDGSSTVKFLDKSMSFDDVDDSFWGKEAIDFATSHKLFKGMSKTEFGTNETMTRSMFVTVLHNLEGAPNGGDISFDDVDEDSWYAKAVAWATKNDIVTGTGHGFNPNGSVTREQVAVILNNYAKLIGVDTGIKGDISKFDDADEISDWALDAMNWIVGSELIKGKDKKNLDPKGIATRAEVAVIVQKFISQNIKDSYLKPQNATSNETDKVEAK